MRPNDGTAEAPKTLYGRLVSRVAGARCPACRTLCGVWRLLGASAGRSRTARDGLICGSCGSVFRLRRSAPRTIALFPVLVVVCLFITPTAFIALLQVFDPRRGGLFFQNNEGGELTFVAGLLLIYPFFLSAAVSATRILGVELRSIEDV